MFKNRSFHVKMVKDEETPAEPSKPPFDYRYIVDEVAAGAVIVIGSYFLADTLRGIITHIVVTKVK